ncbi:MAG TPA: hypothetical protein DHV26_00950 [Cytophagales bacterium]|nr:hypothetical protein [Cytophagales bacterium]
MNSSIKSPGMTRLPDYPIHIKKAVFLLCSLFIVNILYAQKIAFRYPFKFTKKLTQSARLNKGAYIHLDTSKKQIALVLQDMNHTDYVLIDSNMKTLSNFSLPAEKTIFGYQIEDRIRKYYSGAISDGNTYTFIFRKSTSNSEFTGRIAGFKYRQSFQKEVVDFRSKSVSQHNYLSIPKEEDFISSFSQNNIFYAITALDESSSLKIYTLSGDGKEDQKLVPFPLPSWPGKKTKKLSEVLDNTVLITEGEETGLDDASLSSKLYITNESLVFVNDNLWGAHTVKISTSDFSVSSQTIKMEKNEQGKENDKTYTSCFKSGDFFYTVNLIDKSIYLEIHDSSGTKLKTIEINELNIQSITNETGTYEEHKWSDVKSDPVDDFKKLLKAFRKGNLGITAEKRSNGNILVTIGTHDMLPIGSYSPGSSFTSVSSVPQGYGNHTTSTGNMIGPNLSLNIHRTTGISSYSRDSEYYKSTNFKLMLDGTKLTPVKVSIPESVADQVKRQIGDTGSGIISQFRFLGKEYLGYYESGADEYYFKQIKLKK